MNTRAETNPDLPEATQALLGDHLGQVGVRWYEEDYTRQRRLELLPDYWMYISQVFTDAFPVDKRGRPFKYSPQSILTGILYRHLSNCGWRQVPKQYAHHRSLCEYQNKWLENGLWKLLQLRSAMYADQPAYERYLTLCKEYSRTRERHARKLAFQDYREPASDLVSADVSADVSDPVSIDEAGSSKAKAKRPRVRLCRKRRRTTEQLNEQVKQAISELNG